MINISPFAALLREYHQTCDDIRQLKQLRELCRDPRARTAMNFQIEKRTRHARELDAKLRTMDEDPEPDLYPTDMPGPSHGRWCAATGENVSYP